MKIKCCIDKTSQCKYNYLWVYRYFRYTRYMEQAHFIEVTADHHTTYSLIISLYKRITIQNNQ